MREPTNLEKQLMGNEAMLEIYQGVPQGKLAEAVARVKAEAERASRFKIGQRVIACKSPGISLVGGIKELPHDHKDPKQHFESRVVGWDSFGRIEIATQDGGSWCWSEKYLRKIKDGEDWTKKSKYKIGQEVILEPDGTPDLPLGPKFKGKILAPHIKKGDWLVAYERKGGGSLERVVKESQFK